MTYAPLSPTFLATSFHALAVRYLLVQLSSSWSHKQGLILTSLINLPAVSSLRQYVCLFGLILKQQRSATKVHAIRTRRGNQRRLVRRVARRAIMRRDDASFLLSKRRCRAVQTRLIAPIKENRKIKAKMTICAI